MDNRLLFLYRFCRGKGGEWEARLSVPIGHGASSAKGNAGAGKSTLDVIAESGRKLSRNAK